MEPSTIQATTPTLAQRRLIAFQRFGLGAKPGDFGRLIDPMKGLLAELNSSSVALIKNNGHLPTRQQACKWGETGSCVLDNGTVVDGNQPAFLRRELDARWSKHLQPRVGFVERLVIFWANHFSMTVNKEVERVVMGTIGQLERDVIRKHVLGKFPDMLVGVMTHPAMITYLDNQISVGPNSVSAKNGNPFNDINVNLAREIHELHTLGSGGGYKEKDVKELALILSGWAYATNSEAGGGYNGANANNVGDFLYKPDWHEPATSFVHMGRTRPNEGFATGVKVLRWLAMRPATAEHLAFKMLRHFITDRPTATQVDKLASVYLSTGGNLKAMARAMIKLPVAWKLPLRKFRTPYELAAAQYRAMRVRHTSYSVSNGSDLSNYSTTEWNLRFLHQDPWKCLDPDGWDDDTAEWLNPDGVRVRIAAAYEAVSTYAPDSVKVTSASPINLTTNAGVRALGVSILGKNLSAATRAAIMAAPNAKYALAVLFVSPEFQRR
jgi:uncharacterized protein (DUF1800 family)